MTTQPRDTNFQAQSASAKARKTSNTALHERGHISTDNKAYRPTQSDLEQSDDEVSEDGKRRRRKPKKNMIGPLTTLPAIDQEKRRRRRSWTKADGAAGGEEEEEDSGSDHRVSPQVCCLPSACLRPFSRIDLFSLAVQRSICSSHRLSQPQELQCPSSRASVPRDSSVPPLTSFEHDADVTLDSQE